VAGLLDSLFNQGTYGGQGQGLLDMLRQSQMRQEQYYQPSAGFPGQASPMAVGGYQMPRIGDQAQFTPPPVDPAALPPNAQPTQGQLPQAQPQHGGFLQSLNENFQNMGNGGSLIGALTGQSPSNQTAQFLVSKGINPAMAKTISSDPSLLRSVLPSLLTGGQTDDIKEYQFAKKEDPSLTFQKFMAGKRATSGEYSLTPTYGYDENTKETVGFQLGKDGKPKKIELPPGVKMAAGTEKVDAGTHWDIYDKRSGVKVGTMSKNVEGKEAAEKIGQARGTAQAALNNGADLDAEATVKKIDQFTSSKGFSQIFGQLDQYRPSWTMDCDGTDALARYEQLTGVAFLSAYSMLKGGGAITDIEGQKAGAAMARLNRAQSEGEAKKALEDFKEAVDMGLKKLRRAANGGAEPAAPATTSAPKRIKLNADGTIAQ
jgi:hypothetical protein